MAQHLCNQLILNSLSMKTVAGYLRNTSKRHRNWPSLPLHLVKYAHTLMVMPRNKTSWDSDALDAEIVRYETISAAELEAELSTMLVVVSTASSTGLFKKRSARAGRHWPTFASLNPKGTARIGIHKTEPGIAFRTCRDEGRLL